MTRTIERIAARCAHGVRGLTRATLDFVYPPVCPYCSGEAPAADGDTSFSPLLCEECRLRLAVEIGQSCLRCGAPVGPYLDTSHGCIHCRWGRFHFEQVSCLGVYDGPLRSACLRAKGTGGRPLAAALARLLWEQQRETFEQAGIDLLVAVPRHWTRRLTRNHDTPQTLAEVLASRLKVGFGRHILAKVRRTPAQTSLPPYRRRSNLRRAFQVRGKSTLADASVLLVDDILTTGTTANEVSRVLRRSGASRVKVAVLARGIGR